MLKIPDHMACLFVYVILDQSRGFRLLGIGWGCDLGKKSKALLEG